jgi:hypothetical protein
LYGSTVKVLGFKMAKTTTSERDDGEAKAKRKKRKRSDDDEEEEDGGRVSQYQGVTKKSSSPPQLSVGQHQSQQLQQQAADGPVDEEESVKAYDRAARLLPMHRPVSNLDPRDGRNEAVIDIEGSEGSAKSVESEWQDDAEAAAAIARGGVERRGRPRLDGSGAHGDDGAGAAGGAGGQELLAMGGGFFMQMLEEGRASRAGEGVGDGNPSRKSKKRRPAHAESATSVPALALPLLPPPLPSATVAAPKKTSKRKKCPHNRDQYRCKDCKGSAISYARKKCPHNRELYRCKDCKGSGICPHNRVKSQCKDCTPLPSQICQVTELHNSAPPPR